MAGGGDRYARQQQLAREARARELLARGEGLAKQGESFLAREGGRAQRGFDTAMSRFAKQAARADEADRILSEGIDNAIGVDPEAVEAIMRQAMDEASLDMASKLPTPPRGIPSAHQSRGGGGRTPDPTPVTPATPDPTPALTTEELLRHDSIRPLLTEFTAAVRDSLSDRCPTLKNNGMVFVERDGDPVRESYDALATALTELGASGQALRDAQGQIIGLGEQTKEGLLELEGQMSSVDIAPLSAEQRASITASATKAGYAPEGMQGMADSIRDKHLDEALLELDEAPLTPEDMEIMLGEPAAAPEDPELAAYLNSLSPEERAAFDAEVEADLEQMVQEADADREFDEYYAGLSETERAAFDASVEAELEQMAQEADAERGHSSTPPAPPGSPELDAATLAELDAMDLDLDDFSPPEEARTGEHGLQASDTPGHEGPTEGRSSDFGRG